MRVRPEIYEAIRRDAERNGRSVAAQAERRVAYPEPDASDAARMIGLAILAVEQRAGKTWSESVSVKTQCRAAAEFALNMVFGATMNLEKLQSVIESQLKSYENPQKGLGAVDNPTREDLDVVFKIMRDWLDGLKSAEETFETVLGAAL